EDKFEQCPNSFQVIFFVDSIYLSTNHALFSLTSNDEKLLYMLPLPLSMKNGFTQ
ncbi:hypothetical protein ACJX0J_008646, partial [Zea mays]